jgi:hypothetical protein
MCFRNNIHPVSSKQLILALDLNSVMMSIFEDCLTVNKNMFILFFQYHLQKKQPKPSNPEDKGNICSTSGTRITNPVINHVRRRDCIYYNGNIRSTSGTRYYHCSSYNPVFLHDLSQDL